MKTAVVYFTFGGTTKKEAERLAKDLGAVVCRVEEEGSRSSFGVYVRGSYQAMRRMASAIKPIKINLTEYDKIIICCPVWAGYPAPAFNAIVRQLPSGKDVEIILCSASGGTPKSREGTIELVKKTGCRVTECKDVLTNVVSKKIKV